MNIVDQKQIAHEILEGLREHIENAFVEGVPRAWDGHEIRHWISDLARELYVIDSVSWTRQRKHAYNQARLVNPKL